MKPSTEIETQLRQLIAYELSLKESSVLLQSRLIEDLGADHFDIPDLVEAIERVFKITIQNNEVEKLKTVSEIVEFIVSTKKTELFTLQV